MLDFFKAERAATVVDLGCGMGSYVKHFNKHGLTAAGFDGNPATPELTKGRCGVLDLSVVSEATVTYDWALLERASTSPRYMRTRSSKISICITRAGSFRAGVGRPRGTGHVNEQNNDYVKAKICALGYVNDAAAEDALRARARFSYSRDGDGLSAEGSIRDDIKDDGHDEQDEDERIEEEEEAAMVFKATPHAPCWDGGQSRWRVLR